MSSLTRVQVIFSIVISSITMLGMIGSGLYAIKTYADEKYLDEQETVTIVTWVIKKERTVERISDVNEIITVQEFKLRNLENGERDSSLEAFELAQAEKKKTRLQAMLEQLEDTKPMDVN